MNLKRNQQAFSLIELMIASLIGLIVSYAVLQIYFTQSQFYKTSNSQSLILNVENAIINLLNPTIRSTGFMGCGTAYTAMSNLNAGSPAPLGTINTAPTMIAGYSGSGATVSLSQANLANDTNAAHWTPALPASLVGQVEQNNDVLIVLGAMPGTYPLGITQIDNGSSSLMLQSTGTTSLAANQLAAVSDCAKSIIFAISGVNGTTISHVAGSGSMKNALSAFPINFPVGSQFVSIQQTAFFVGQGQGGQSTLMRGILNGNTWTVEPLVPGIELMKVQYGIGTNSLITQYVSADSVTDWTRVYSVRLGFLIAGKIGSSSSKTSYTVLDTTVTVPEDSLLRHTFEMTIQLRNSI